MPVQAYIHTERVGSAILLAAAVTALVWANSPWSFSYHNLWETELTLDLAIVDISGDLHHWINEGLMALFFLVVGLEVKRELLHGTLSSPRRAALPAFAAVGGMVVPAAVYGFFNPEPPAVRGWGIPMATDIAFALGILGLVGRGAPSGLRVFLLALAVVDDLGALLVTVVLYTETVVTGELVKAALLVATLVLLRMSGIRHWLVYAAVGFLFWAAVLESGVHATLAGVVLGLLTPSRPHLDPDEFGAAAPGLVERHEAAVDRGDHDDAQATLGRLEALTRATGAPLERLERTLHPLTAWVVLPVFALANAGVELTGAALAAALGSPVTLGIVAGLVGGKLVGVTLAAWIAVVSGLAELPHRVRWSHVVGTALLAGVGFTMSLFITTLAFVEGRLVAEARVGILAASLLAGALGFLVLRLAADEPEPAARG